MEDEEKLLKTQISISRRMQHLSEPPDIIEETDDGAGTVTTYIGYAGVGTHTTSDSTWLIIRIVEVTAGLVITTEKKYANASFKKNSKWTDRTLLLYYFTPKG